MFVQTPLSHTFPASHSSLSAGHRGVSGARPGGGFRLLFSLCCPFVWSTRAEPRGPSPRSHTQTMHDVGAKCSQDSSAMFDAKELMSSQPSSTLTDERCPLVSYCLGLQLLRWCSASPATFH